MIEFREDLLTNNDLVVNCKTEEQADNLLAWAKTNGVEYPENYWEEYKENSTYHIHSGTRWSIDVHSSHDKTILSYEEALWKKPEEEEEIPTIILAEKVPQIYVANTGDFDLSEILYFSQDLLEKGYQVHLEIVGNLYELKGYKDD